MEISKLLGDNLTKCWEVTCDGLVSHPEGVEILLVALALRQSESRRANARKDVGLRIFYGGYFTLSTCG